MNCRIAHRIGPPIDSWQILAELPYHGSLREVYYHVQTLRHILIEPFDECIDRHIVFTFRGYWFRIDLAPERLDFWISDGDCPVDILMVPLGHLIETLSIRPKSN